MACASSYDLCVPVRSASAPVSDVCPIASTSRIQSRESPQNRAMPSNHRRCHSTNLAMHRKFSSSFQRCRPPEGVSSSAGRIARREMMLWAVASLASVNGSSAVDVAGILPGDFSWLDKNPNEKENGPIQYDNRDLPLNVYAPGRRIVAVGDVHGDLARTECALQLAGVLSSDGLGHWIGGTSVLVQVGDILDRGEDEIAILSLLHNLGQQALLSGGAVFQINGNHETMNVEGDYRFAHPGGFDEAMDFREYCEEDHEGDYEAAFAGWYLASKKRKANRSNLFIVSWLLNPLRKVAARAFLFNPGGPIARKLSQHGVVLKINDWLFAHGGVLPHHVEYGLDNLNREVSQWMRGDLVGNRRKQLPFMAIRGYDSIVWSRLYSRDDHSKQQDKINVCATLEATLEAVGAKALVVGHTPQLFGANCECKGQVWRIDVGMSRGMLNAVPQVLEINGNKAHVLSGKSYKKDDTSFLRFSDLRL